MGAPPQMTLQAESEARLRFELLLADVCAKFANVAPDEIDALIENAQRVICESLRVDHSTVWQVSADNPDRLDMTHVYRDPNLKPLPSRPGLKEYFPWSYSQILNREIVCVPTTATLPPEAAKDKESWEQYGIHSSLVFPLSVGSGSTVGILAFDSMKERDWSEPIRRQLQILAYVFAQGLNRKNAEQKVKMVQEALRASEERLRLAQKVACIGTFERDVRTGVVTWTEETEAMYGLPSGGFNGTTTATFENLIHPDDRERVMGLTHEAIKTGRPTKAEWRVIWPNGSIHWIAGWWQVFMDESEKPRRMIGVNMDVTERKLAEQALLAHQQLLKTFVKNVPVAVAMLDHELRYLQVSDRWCIDNSVEASALLGRLREEIPEMPEPWKDANRRALQGETLRADEERWESGGSTRWARWEVRPWRRSDNTVGGILVFAEDITDRKEMEEALSGMTRKLVEAQEQERARIGRELHDDISQRLAMLAIELEQLKENPSEFESRVQELRKKTSEISSDVQALSHDLHPSKLEYLGVVAGMKSWCKEFGERRKMQIDYKHDLRSTVPPEVGLCLFRVLQEALQNAAKHSGVKKIEVQVREDSGEIHLIVRDSGKGFDIEAARQGRGLGLITMRERIRLVNGSIDIQSTPMGGTTIHARVPFISDHVSPRLAV